MTKARIVAHGASSIVLQMRLIQEREKTRPIAFLVENGAAKSREKIARLNGHGNGLTATTQQRMPNSLTVTATTFLCAFSTTNNNGEEDGCDPKKRQGKRNGSS